MYRRDHRLALDVTRLALVKAFLTKNSAYKLENPDRLEVNGAEAVKAKYPVFTVVVGAYTVGVPIDYGIYLHCFHELLLLRP